MHHQPVGTFAEEDGWASPAHDGLVPRELDWTTQDTGQTPLDDVFESAPSEHRSVQEAAHPSDMPRLQSEHTTAGYREGITLAKESTIQAGFDEGFGLGATIGLRAGRLLGMLEGIQEAIKTSADGAVAQEQDLFAEARHELATSRIFDSAYWAPDGNWTFDVHPTEGEDIVFADVANAHPLIRKWSGVVDRQMKLWKIDETILAAEPNQQPDTLDTEPTPIVAPSTARRPLDW
ncbi:hypothetical protein HIM_04908 [Hirsutella minnesotensis 3608]|uniref:Protein YAE1 n=1 Tax=Hirsutella minnesotensis 3608 TaxID=1043627 RepID=A0A0F7ZKX8_9HYPO|nr:hypothetical protein HIM_04908 [Hirsutella minnesotensis 3608]